MLGSVPEASGVCLLIQRSDASLCEDLRLLSRIRCGGAVGDKVNWDVCSERARLSTPCVRSFKLPSETETEV